MRSLLLAAVLATVLAGCGSDDEPEPAAAGGAEPPIEYSGAAGPEHWGDLHEDWKTCGEGRSQSPVDLAGAEDADAGALRFDYRPGPVSVSDSGHSIVATPSANDDLRVGGRTVGTLKQLHYHAPSEHRIGDRGFAMEIHLVHTDEAGATTVVAVFAEEGEPNVALAQLGGELPESSEQPVVGTLDVGGLLPDDLRSVRYDGSLTTPPCTEGIRWIVLTTPVTLSAEQLAGFDARYDGNNRPLQPLNGRPLAAVR